MKNPVFNQIARQGVVPVIAIDDAGKAIPLADALLAGGLPIVEITFRTAAAADVIATLVEHRPEITVGAGTVLDAATAKLAASLGAKFAVAPGLNPSVVEAAAEAGLPFISGVATPSEVEQGLSYGLELLKFFPAGAMGGVKYLNAIYAPYRHTGVKFMATGGIRGEDVPEWMACPAVAAIGGSWIAKPADIAHGLWGDIEARSRAASAAVPGR